MKLVDCRSSMLNFAKRYADINAMNNGIRQIRLELSEKTACVFNSSTVINEGASPNVTTSARESSSFPIGDDTFKALAVNPSKKSNIAPAMISNDGSIGMVEPFKSYRKYIANMPQSRFDNVRTFGICLRIIFGFLSKSKITHFLKNGGQKRYFLLGSIVIIRIFAK